MNVWMPKNKMLLGLAGLAGLALILTAPTPAQAQLNDDGFDYVTNLDGTITVTNYTGLSGCVTIPSTIDGLTVSAIGNGSNAVFTAFSPTNVTIPDSVLTIEDYAFYTNSYLTNVTFGSNVDSIGEYSFDECTNLTNVTLPDSLLTIGYYAFAYDESMTNCALGANLLTIDDYAFYECGLQQVTIPPSVTEIGYGGFYECYYLTNLTIQGAPAIEDYAFYYCEYMQNISIAGGTIGYAAFEYNYYLTNICLGDVTSISDYAFYYACYYADGNLKISASKTHIGEYAFCYAYYLTNVTILGDAEIDYGAFYEAYYLQNVCMHGGNIGYYAFYYTELTNLVIGDGPTSIGEYAFYDDDYLGNVTIGTNCSNVASYAFYDCEYMTNAAVSGYIDPYAFYDCDELANLTVNNGVIPDYCFEEDYDLTNVTINYSSIGTGAFEDDDYIYNLNIGPGCTTIGDQAFYDCEDMYNANIQSGDIGYGAFAYCYYMTNLTLGPGVTSIGEYAFDDDDDLLNVVVPVNVTNLGEGAFEDCSGLTSATVDSAYVGDYAFYDCYNLTNITFGPDVIALGSEVFDEDTSLTGINFQGNAPAASDSAFYGVNDVIAAVYYNPDTSGWGSYFAGLPTMNAAGPQQPQGYLNDNSFDYVTNLDGTITVTNYTGLSGCVTIPSMIDGLTVTVVGNGSNAVFTAVDLTNVIIPDSVLEIADYAFYTNYYLTNVTFGSNVDSIGEYSFDECTNLTSVTLPDSVLTVGYEAFGYDYYITNCTLGTNLFTIDDYAFYADEELQQLTIPASVVSINEGAFEYCTNMTNLVINGAPDIGYEAFYDDYQLYNASIAGGSIEYEAFYECSNLISLSLGGVTSIGYYAFYDCGMTNLIIPASVNTIGEYAFYYEPNMTNVTICGTPDIGEEAFYDDPSLQTAYIAGGTFGYESFYYNTNLTNVTIGNGPASIGDYAFYYDTNLVNVTMGTNVSSMGYYAFGDDYLLQTATVSGSLDVYAFDGDTYLANLTVNNGSIPDYCFYDSTGPANVTINNSSIGFGAFEYDTYLTNLAIGPGCTLSGYSFDECEHLQNACIGSGNPNDYCFAYCYDLTNVTFGPGVTSIGEYAFYDDDDLPNLMVPVTVTNIGEGAFEDCSGLTSATVDSAYVGDYAFYDCSSLTNITFGPDVSLLGSETFDEDTSLAVIYFEGNPPSASGTVFYGVNGAAIVYYNPNANGWGSSYGGLVVESGLLQTTFTNLIVNTSNLLGFWPFTSASQFDSVVNGYTGTPQGNAAIACNSGPALYDMSTDASLLLDGSTAYVTTSLSGELTNDEGSILAWFYVSNLPSASTNFYYIAGESQLADDFDLQINPDNTIGFYTSANGDNTSYTQPLATNNIGAWHFVAATFTSPSSRDVYIDGALVASGVPAGPHDASGTGTFTMGGSEVFDGRYFEGQLADIAVYNRQLSATEISNLYFVAVGGSNMLSVALTSPTNGESFNSSCPVTLNAAVSGGQADTSVTFYNGCTNLGQVFAAPYTLSLGDLAPGNYCFKVVASNYNGLTAASAVASVSVQAVSITSQPVGVTNAAGSCATFSVGVFGAGPFSYEWQINGSNLLYNTITTVAGTTNGFSGDGGAATNAELFHPVSVAVDDCSNLYIVDNGNNRIRKVCGGTITTIAGDGTAGYSGDNGPATNAELNNPEDVYVSSSDKVYIADTSNNVIRKINASGIICTVAGTGVAGFSGDGGLSSNALLSFPTGLTRDGNSNYYIVDDGNQRVRMVDHNTSIITTFAGTGTAGHSGDGGLATNAELNDPYRAVFDNQGNLYIAELGNQDVRKVATSGIITTVAGNQTAGFSGDGGLATNAELNHPVGIAVDAFGNLFIGDQDNYRIREVETTGVIVTFAGDGTAGYAGDCGLATSAELNYPAGVVADSSGNLFIADKINDRIRKVAAFGSSLTLTNISYINDGSYDVVVANSNGAVTSSSAILDVTGPPPVITVAPQDVSTNAGAETQFSVEVSGTGPFGYQWLYITNNVTNALSDGDQFTGSQTDDLTISNVSLANAGTYEIIVTNGYGATNAYADLSVYLLPTVVSTIPANSQLGVPTNAIITATFDENINSGTLTANNFFVLDESNNIVPGSICYNSDTFTASFTPSNPLAVGVSYTVTLTTNVADFNANTLATNYVWSFSCGNLFETNIGSVILGANDDNSSSEISLPFTVFIFGTAYNNFWINNNGNVTFNGPLSEFSSEAFPNSDHDVIVAPFWADVDTDGAGSGYVHYNTFADHVAITWDDVGYYFSHTDKLNTFQLDIFAPTVTDQNLFVFSYGEMEWTTGDASGGENGFGGDDAEAGFDSGNGTNAVAFFSGNTPASLTNIEYKTFYYLSGSGLPTNFQASVANFTATPTNGFAPLQVMFSGPASDNVGDAVTSWNWTFGDGGTSTNQNPTYTYTNAGVYSPSLTVGFASQASLVSAGPSITVAAPPMGVTIVSPTNGQTFSAPASFTLTACVTNATNAMVSFYNGSCLLATVCSQPYTYSVSDLAAGGYGYTAVATTNNIYYVTSAVVAVTVNTPGTTLIDFDPLAVDGSIVGGTNLAAYMAQFGLTVTNDSPGTTVAAENQTIAGGGGFVKASSSPNILTQLGSNGPVSFTVGTATLLSQFTFTRPTLLANPSVSHPAWEADAYDSLGNLLASTNEDEIFSTTNVPAATFTLTGGGIASVQFNSEGTGLTTFNAMLLDDFVLTPGNSENIYPSIVITSPTNDQVITGGADIPITVATAAGTGTVTGVAYYYGGTNVAGSSASSPFSFTWTPPGGNGAYVLTAVVTNNSGLISTSAPVSVTLANGFAIETPPMSEVVGLGRSAQFTVTTTESNISYQWQFDGSNIAGATGSSFAVTNAQTTNAGSYAVVVTSGGQSITTPSALLTVLGPPTVNPISVTTNNNNIVLGVVVSDVTNFYVQWLLNGQILAGTASNYTAGTSTDYYSFTNVVFNSGNYGAVAANGVASANTAPTNIALGPPLTATNNNTFATSLAINPLAGPVAGMTFSNTLQSDEFISKIAGKNAQRFLWFNWTATFTGAISLTTLGSSYDTLLGVYTTNVGTPTSSNSFTSVAQNDDLLHGFFTSLVTFNCGAGTNYYIAVAGHHSAYGYMVLGLGTNIGDGAGFVATAQPAPVILANPVNQVVDLGATVVNNVTATNATNYQWYFDSIAVSSNVGGTLSNLVLTNFPASEAGIYYVDASNATAGVQSDLASIQYQTTNGGVSSSNLAWDKFNDAAELTGSNVADKYRPLDAGGETGGFTLSQSFSTLGATKEEGEPNHAGQPGGASYWYTYIAPTPGTYTFTTAGSSFPTILAVYESLSLPASFNTLSSVGFPTGGAFVTDLNSQAVVVVSNAIGGEQFYIAIDGYGGTSGAAVLNVTFQPTNIPLSTNAVLATNAQKNSQTIVAITSPANDAVVTTSNITVKGTVRGVGGSPVFSSVQVTVNTNAAATATTNGTVFTPVIVNNGGVVEEVVEETVSWTINVSLMPGANQINAQTLEIVDNNSNLAIVSIPATRTVFYATSPPSSAVQSTLTLLTSGDGRVSGERNGASLEVNKVYKVTAVPATGSVFTNWTSGTNAGNLTPLSSDAALAFLMSSNLVLQANFIANPFPAVAGTYNGLFSPTNGVTNESSGFFTATIPAASRGAYSAKLTLDGGTYPFSGTFDLSGDAGPIVVGPSSGPWGVTLHVDLATNDGQMTGTVYNFATNGWTSQLQAWRAALTAQDYAGHYTLVIPPGTNAPVNGPAGYGYVTLSDNATGHVTLSGRLGDGTSINQSVLIATNGYIPLYVPLYSHKGSLLGWLTLTNGSGTKTVLGTNLTWSKPAVKSGLYSGGFTNTNITILGSLYTPGAGAPVLTNGTLTFSNGNLASALVYSNITIVDNKISPSSDVHGVLNPSTGILTLTFHGPDGDTVARGVILQTNATTNAAGTFLGPSQSGYFILQQ